MNKAEVDQDYQGEGDRDYRSDTMMRMMMSRTKILGRGAAFPISLKRHILCLDGPALTPLGNLKSMIKFKQTQQQFERRPLFILRNQT